MEGGGGGGGNDADVAMQSRVPDNARVHSIMRRAAQIRYRAYKARSAVICSRELFTERTEMSRERRSTL